jgi:hypothetical protein
VAKFTAKLGIWNSTKRLRIVWVEPWAEDFTLLPKERLEITVTDESVQPWFCVVERPDSSQAYIESGGSDYEITQEGKRLECGHNRQAGLAAGLKY